MPQLFKDNVVLEVAMLNVKKGEYKSFEETFQRASVLISDMEGYLYHELHHCMEEEGKYLLLVKWETLEHHTIGFRQSPQYQEWKRLLHHFYEPFPTVEHFSRIY